ncbi:MAG: rod shape-determining protein MreC [Gemmatimonadaceae bacterium]|nr:rod shape-determining protein MreC [Gemmatimonadaceae bacterium]
MMARAARGGTRVDAALLVVCALLALLAMVLPGSTRDAIAGVIQRTVAAPLFALQVRSERARTALADREHVAMQLDSLALRVTQLSQLEGENARLRQLLALGRNLRQGFVPAEALHGQDLGDSHALLLTVGSRAGVVPRSAVVAPQGVVGLVTSVGQTSSQAILFSHPDFRVSAMSADGETFGIVGPHLSGNDAACAGAGEAACAGPERLLLELRGVAFRDVLKPGALVTSSGLGGVFPRGILIGTVIGELRTTEQWSRTYLLRPSVRPQDVSNVMVLSPSLVSENLSGIWDTVGAGTAVVARVVAAGDSLARRQAVDSIARQRAADSVSALGAAPDTGLARPLGGGVPARRDSMAVAPEPARRDSTARRRP